MPDDATAISSVLRSEVPGYRPIHAIGVAATGCFEASPVARRFSEAAHFAGGQVPVTVRFSDGVRMCHKPDPDRVVRGMALRFHLGEVTHDEHRVPHGSSESDMVSMSLGVFFVKTPDRFLEFAEAAASTRLVPRSAWRWVRDVLTLERTSRRARRGDVDLIAFADHYPPARLAVISHLAPFLPESYATVTYHAVHAFKLVAGPAVTWGRFHWEPVAGVRPARAGTTPDLKEELGQRIARAPVQFVLRMDVAEQGDDTSDPTTVWPKNGRRRVVMGHLWLDALAPDQIHGGELLGFNPTNLVPGIEVSDDEILRVRGEVYPTSFTKRLGEWAAG